MNYYNEFDPYAAQWLRNLIEAGHIPQGEVDSRSIKDVRASDLTGFVQCHFFAGLGGWSHALRLAGWPEDRPVWTGSCPCQPFSAAGVGGGVTDERHLWPVWFNLIRECRPHVIFGEQVEAAINHGWLDLVQSDLESEGYACGAVGIPAGGVRAPHIRQRLWFVADAQSVGRRIQHTPHNGSANAPSNTLANANDSVADQRRSDIGELGDAEYAKRGAERQIDTDAHGRDGLGRCRDLDQLAESNSLTDERRRNKFFTPQREETGRCNYGYRGSGAFDQLADTLESRRTWVGGGSGTQEQRTAQCGASSFWSDCDWLPCRDGKARPVEPGTFPLAYGATARVGRLRAYGNAIVPQVAQVFIEAYLET